MRKFTNELLQHTQLKIEKESKKGSPGFELYNACYQILRVTFGQLKQFIIQYKFKNQKEEIEFFKDIKPVFQSQLMFYMELIQIEIRKPTVSEKKELIKYYREVSCHYRQLLKRNELFLHYIRTQLTNADHLMFVRSHEAAEMLHTDIVDLDDRFSTPASSELAKIGSYEMLIEHIGDKLFEIRKGEAIMDLQPYATIWTGSKAALIELAYALHAAKTINHGMVEIKQIIAALEGIFKIKLTDFYRVFQSIRIRQSSRTVFLDELKEKIIERMDDTDIHGR